MILIYAIFLGLKKANEEKRDAVMRSEYFHPIERFPERTDQLLDTLNRVCRALIIYILLMIFQLSMSQQAERSRIQDIGV